MEVDYWEVQQRSQQTEPTNTHVYKHPQAWVTIPSNGTRVPSCDTAPARDVVVPPSLQHPASQTIHPD